MYWKRTILRKSDRSSTSRVSSPQPESSPQASILSFIRYHLPHPLGFLLSQISSFHSVFSSLIATTQPDRLSVFIQHILQTRHCTRYNTLLTLADMCQLIPLAALSRLFFQLEVTGNNSNQLQTNTRLIARIEHCRRAPKGSKSYRLQEGPAPGTRNSS